MTVETTQISANISVETKALLEKYAEAQGVKKAFVIEEALLHHLQALNELPTDIVIPPRLLYQGHPASGFWSASKSPNCLRRQCANCLRMIKVGRLEPTDDRSGFRSGNPDLDRFFIRYAGQNQFRHHIGTTYVAVKDDRILGFVTVAPSQIEIDDLPRARRKRLPRYPLPVLRLARLAVNERAQGKA